jgi:hypothetical protein
MSNKPFNPESTTFANLALDKIMPNVSPNAWKILCFAIRKTAGWADSSTVSKRKESDVISISQFRIGCGISSNDTVKSAIDECLSCKYLLRSKEGMSFRYRINYNYEFPTVTDSVTPTVTDSVTITVTESVNTNSNINSNINNKEIPQKKLQNVNSLPAKEEDSNMTTTEEYKKRTEEALFASLSNKSDYAQFPEDIRPVAERMEKLWHFRAPNKSKKKGGQYAFWIESCRDLLDACGEFRAEMLDDLHKDWYAYQETHGGLAPYTVSSPKSLISAALSKSANLRGGNKSPLWGQSIKPAHQSTLDV